MINSLQKGAGTSVSYIAFRVSLSGFFKGRSNVSYFTVYPLQFCEKSRYCFKFLVRPYKGLGKTAFPFQSPLKITTESRKTTFLFQYPFKSTTELGKTAFLFQSPPKITTESRKTTFLFQYPFKITTESGKTAFLFQSPPKTTTESR